MTELGAVLAGDARRAGARDDEITVFDSTGLAIQDLAIALAALERADELDLPTLRALATRVAARPDEPRRVEQVELGRGSPRIARATRSPAASPSTLPWPE